MYRGDFFPVAVSCARHSFTNAVQVKLLLILYSFINGALQLKRQYPSIHIYCRHNLYGSKKYRNIKAVSLTWTVIYPWRRRQYFFLANFYLKQDISSENDMVDFICMRLLELWGTPVENYKMKKSCLCRDLNPVPSAYAAKALTISLRDLIPIEPLKVYHLWPVLSKFTCSMWVRIPLWARLVHFVILGLHSSQLE